MSKNTAADSFGPVGFISPAAPLETCGLGGRWLAGDAIEGVLLAHNDAVSIVEGPHSG